MAMNLKYEADAYPKSEAGRIMVCHQAKKHETAAEHFKRCGPFCTHVDLCEACSSIFGLCDKHAKNPDGTFQWKWL